jgi:hypothetical protein
MRVKVTGAAQKIDQIFRFDKNAWKVMQAGVRAAGSAVQKDAQARMPSIGLTKWGMWDADGRDLSYDAGQAKRITVSVRSREVLGFRRVKAKVGFASGNAAGAIFSLAGVNPGTTSRYPQRSRNFKTAMNKEHGGAVGMKRNQTWPRALTPAYYAKGPQAREQIGAAIERMVAQVNK